MSTMKTLGQHFWGAHRKGIYPRTDQGGLHDRSDTLKEN